MRQSVTQEFEFGCGIACFAFAAGLTYKEAAYYLGPKQAASNRFWCKDLAVALTLFGVTYHHKHLNSLLVSKINTEGTIVLIARSKNYPAGHYLINHEGFWMDPWINLPFNRNINDAQSGFRNALPGRPIYGLFYDSAAGF